MLMDKNDPLASDYSTLRDGRLYRINVHQPSLCSGLELGVRTLRSHRCLSHSNSLDLS